ncbi:hypothetical protein B0H13DRAFT_2556137 [Mycena leptocephala]|nr:hypothetical protein B0H13DRAFT_2556137 [Mycena leptocephala]
MGMLASDPVLWPRNVSKQLNVLNYLYDVRFVEGSLEQRLLGRFSSYILCANNLVRGYFDPQSDVCRIRYIYSYVFASLRVSDSGLLDASVTLARKSTKPDFHSSVREFRVRPMLCKFFNFSSRVCLVNLQLQIRKEWECLRARVSWWLQGQEQNSECGDEYIARTANYGEGGRT